jgi:RNA recognition motif-containing protein
VVWGTTGLSSLQKKKRRRKKKMRRVLARCVTLNAHGGGVDRALGVAAASTTTTITGRCHCPSSSSSSSSSSSASIFDRQQQQQQRRSMGLFATSSSSSSSSPSSSASSLIRKEMRLMSATFTTASGDDDGENESATSLTTEGDTTTPPKEEEEEKGKLQSSSSAAAATATTTTTKRRFKKFVPMTKRAKQEGLTDDSGHLGLRNLPHGVAANDLRKLFSKFGEIRSVKSICPDVGKPRAHIRFRFLADAEKALEALQSEEGIVIGPSKSPGEKRWEGRRKRREKEAEVAGEGEGKEISSLSSEEEEEEEEKEEDGVSGDDNDDGMRRIKGEIYDPTKPKRSEVIAEMRRERRERSFAGRNTTFRTDGSEPLIRTFQEENEEQTRMVVHKDPLEGIDTTGMTPSEIRKLTLQKRREQREEHFAKQKRVAEMKQKVMKDMRSERLADGAMKARSYVPRYKRDENGNVRSASDTDMSLPSLQVRDQRTRRDASFGGKTFELRKRNAAAGAGQKKGRRERNPENDRIKLLLRERVEAAKKMQTDGVELDYDISRLERDMQMQFGEYTSWPMGMDQKPWTFGEKDPNEDVSPEDYLDSKKAFVMEQLSLTSDSQYESLKKDALEEFEKMLAKEKYRTEKFGESPAEDVFEHRKMIFDMANEAVDNEKNPLYKFARRAASILDANPGWSFGKKKKLFDRLSIDAKQFDDWEEESSTNQRQ